MMFLENPPQPQVKGWAPGGEASSLGEIWTASAEYLERARGSNSADIALGEAYDARNAAIRRATNVELWNPILREREAGSGRISLKNDIDQWGQAAYQRRLDELATQFPHAADVIRADRPVLDDAKELARQAEQTYNNVWGRASGGVLDWAAMMGGSIAGDPGPQVAGLVLGPWGNAAKGAAGLAWYAIKTGAANATVEAMTQPAVQAWRAKAGLSHGLDEAALDIGMAFLLGGAIDLGVRAPVRGLNYARGRTPVLDEKGLIVGWRDKKGNIVSGGEEAVNANNARAFRDYDKSAAADPVDALDQAARRAPEGSPLKKAVDGNEGALRDIAKATGADEDPAVRGSFQQMDNDRVVALPDDAKDLIAEAEHLEKLAHALNHAHDPNMPPPGDAIRAPKPAKERPDLTDDAPGKLGDTLDIDGKPVVFRAVDPKKIETDADTFQFKSNGDSAGVTERLRGVTKWDPLAAGKAVVYEYADGRMVIADGHQRLGLAKRLAEGDPNIRLHAYVFREADGFTPADVRAYAALKNMKELSGTPLDMAKVMRERPDLVDGSLPLSDGKMREAVNLSRLSDEAFGMVVNGHAPASFAALLGDHVPQAHRHAGLLKQMMDLDPGSVQEARLALRQLLAAPQTSEHQLTLFGSEVAYRSMLQEKIGVLNRALNALKKDKRIFGLLDKEAGRITEAGNKLAEDVNTARADEAARLSEVIEQLATRSGVVADALNDVTASIARGVKPQMASRAFLDRMSAIMEKDGVKGLMRDSEARAPVPERLDDPHGPDAENQIKRLESETGLGERVKAEDKGEATFEVHPDQGVMFALKAWHGSPRKFTRFDFSKIGSTEKVGLGLADEDPTVFEGWGIYATTSKDEAIDYGGDGGHLYRVKINDKAEHTLDLLKPINGQPPKIARNLRLLLDKELISPKIDIRKTEYAYEAWVDNNYVKAWDVRNEGAEAAAIESATKFLDHLKRKDVTAGELYRFLAAKYGPRMATEKLIDAGVKVNRADRYFVALTEDVISIQSRNGKNLASEKFKDVMRSLIKKRVKAKDGKPVSDAERADAMFALKEGGERAKSTSDSLKGTYISVPRGLADWLRVPHKKFTADYTAIAGKRKARPSSVDLSSPEAVREHVEHVLSDAVIAMKSGSGQQWDLIVPQQGRTIGVRLIPEGQNYKVSTALVYDPGQLARRFNAVLEAHGEQGLRWKGQAGASTISALIRRRAVRKPGDPSIDDFIRRLREEQGGPDFALPRHSARDLAQDTQVRAAIDKALSRVLPPSVRRRVREALVYGGREVDGWYDTLAAIVHVSLAAENPLAVAYHEAGHALRATGLLDDVDFGLLWREAEKLGLRKEYDIDGKYGEVYGQRYKGDKARLEDALREETVMHMLGDRLATGRDYGSTLNRILDPIIRFLRAVAEAVHLRERTAADVIADIGSGRLARKEGEFSLPQGNAKVHIDAVLSEIVDDGGRGRDRPGDRVLSEGVASAAGDARGSGARDRAIASGSEDGGAGDGGTPSGEGELPGGGSGEAGHPGQPQSLEKARLRMMRQRRKAEARLVASLGLRLADIERPDSYPALRNAVEAGLDAEADGAALMRALGFPPEIFGMARRLALDIRSLRDDVWGEYRRAAKKISISPDASYTTQAHEWWHAFDDYFGSFEDKNHGFMSERRGGEAPVPIGRSARPEVTAAFDHLYNVIFKGTVEPMRLWRALRSLINQKELERELLTLQLPEPTGGRNHPEIDRLLTEMNALERQAIAVASNLDVQKSLFVHNAEIKDRFSGREYWANPAEITARAFEHYVHERLGLPADLDGLRKIAAHDKEAVFDAFDRLFATVRMRETPNGLEFYALRANPAADYRASAALQDAADVASVCKL